MNKKKVWLVGILVSVLITTPLWATKFIIGGNGETGTESSEILFLTFFTVFVLPGVIQQQKKRREQMLRNYQLEEE